MSLNKNKEIWKPIKGYEGVYSVSSFGKVKRHNRYVGGKYGCKRRIKEKILKNHINKRGYEYVVLGYKQQTKSLSIHRLIATHFIPNPGNKEEVNHINGLKTDNTVGNLEWCTREENMAHAVSIGRFHSSHNRGEKNKRAVLKKSDVINIRMLRSLGKSYAELCEMYSVSMGCIQGIVQRRNWKHVS